MEATVKEPNGTTTYLGTVYNAPYNKSYTFSQTGLYSITVTARDTNNSLYGSNLRSTTFQVRVY